MYFCYKSSGKKPTVLTIKRYCCPPCVPSCWMWSWASLHPLCVEDHENSLLRKRRWCWALRPSWCADITLPWCWLFKFQISARPDLTCQPWSLGCQNHPTAAQSGSQHFDTDGCLSLLLSEETSNRIMGCSYVQGTVDAKWISIVMVKWCVTLTVSWGAQIFG